MRSSRGQDVVLPGLDQEGGLEFLDLLRVLCGEIVGLGEALGDPV
jgi:hypothetical protein